MKTKKSKIWGLEECRQFWDSGCFQGVFPYALSGYALWTLSSKPGETRLKNYRENFAEEFAEKFAGKSPKVRQIKIRDSTQICSAEPWDQTIQDHCWGESKGYLIKGCLNSTKIPKVGIPKAGIPTVGIPKTGILKVGNTHSGTLLKTEIPKPGVPKSGVPKTGIPKAGIPKLGIPKTCSFTAPVIQTPLRLPLTLEFRDAIVIRGVLCGR